jgi:hypothetical protein
MLKSTKLTVTVSTVLLTLMTACSQGEVSPNTSVTPASPTPAASPPSLKTKKAKAVSSTPSPTTQSDRFQEALDAGMGAAVIAQSAASKDDWNLVSSNWQKAINLLKAVPKSSRNYTTAQKKIAEYQRNLTYARQQGNRAAKLTDTASVSPAAAPQQPSTPPTPTSDPFSDPPVPTPASAPRQPGSSVAPEMGLAMHLRRSGAKLYGTYWCSYCNRQKAMFGEEAFSQINYIECDPAGKNAKPAICRQAKISGYPTWAIKGNIYPGMKSLQELADLSGYQGDRNFRN